MLARDFSSSLTQRFSILSNLVAFMSPPTTAMYTGLAVLTELLYIGLSSHPETVMDGDLIIGGLFPVHEQGVDGRPCGRLSEGRGIHRVEAMLFAIDYINNDSDLLPVLEKNFLSW